jgi:hypothetical protein
MSEPQDPKGWRFVGYRETVSEEWMRVASRTTDVYVADSGKVYVRDDPARRLDEAFARATGV